MKMMKLTCSLAFALAVALAATGCKNHKPVGVTPLPGSKFRRMVGEHTRRHLCRHDRMR